MFDVVVRTILVEILLFTILDHMNVKAFLLLVEEFICNHEIFKLHEERDEAERGKLGELRGTLLVVGSLEDFIDDNHSL